MTPTFKELINNLEESQKAVTTSKEAFDKAYKKALKLQYAIAFLSGMWITLVAFVVYGWLQ